MQIRWFWIIVLLSLGSVRSYSQNEIAKKERLDSALLRGDLQWSEISAPQISPDGKYASYIIIDKKENRILVSMSTEGKWKKECRDIRYGLFTSDSRWLIFQWGDSLVLQGLGRAEEKYIRHVSSFELVGEGGQQLLVYRLTGEKKQVALRRISDGKEKIFDGVQDYKLNKDNSVIILQKENKSDSTSQQELDWVDLVGGKSKLIWKGANVGGIVFDEQGQQVAFTVEVTDDTKTERSIWYYKEGMESAVKEIDNETQGISAGFELDESAPVFSKDGDRLFFQLKEMTLSEKAPKDAVKVDVWNYQDLEIQSRQLHKHKIPFFYYFAVKKIGSSPVISLQRKDEIIFFGHDGKDEYAIVQSIKGDGGVDLWNPAAFNSYSLVSTRDGSRQIIKKKDPAADVLNFFHFSPDGQYLVFTRISRFVPCPIRDWYCYRIATGLSYPINKSIPYPIDGVQPEFWLRDGKEILVYDDFDIWRVDLSGAKQAVCITGGYGRKKGIRFRIARDRVFYNDEFDEAGRMLNNTDELLLETFDTRTKQSGFYRMIKGNTVPQLLVMGDYFLGHAPAKKGDISGCRMLLKARDANAWIVTRQSATEAPNLYYTTDFKNYISLSHIAPQSKYTWLTSALINWKLPDGKAAQGVLYKPDNFDPHQKYPLIIQYYDGESDQLHSFPEPELCASDVRNAPYWTSRGYLLFKPDITYRTGHPGQSALEAVESAARRLMQFPYVDGKHMGINGHSFGGFETNYIITHSHLFAAAVSAAGVSDVISSYLGLEGTIRGQGGQATHAYYERGQGRIGTTLWEHPELYIENSAVLKADEVTTPLLVMHNQMDASVLFDQAIEFFTALRRLGKRAWLIQYDNFGHVLSWEKEQKDYTIRLSQFFDHYLKGAPAPKWMLDGIPAKLKGIETGYELDATGREPKEQPVLYKGKVQLVRDADKK